MPITNKDILKSLKNDDDEKTSALIDEWLNKEASQRYYLVLEDMVKDYVYEENMNEKWFGGTKQDDMDALNAFCRTDQPDYAEDIPDHHFLESIVRNGDIPDYAEVQIASDNAKRSYFTSQFIQYEHDGEPEFFSRLISEALTQDKPKSLNKLITTLQDIEPYIEEASNFVASDEIARGIARSHDYTDPEDFNLFCEKVESFCEIPYLKQKLSGEPSFAERVTDQIIRSSDATDMVHEFSNRIMLPALYLLAKEGTENTSDPHDLTSTESSKVLETFAETISKKALFSHKKSDILLPLRLSKSWHEPVNVFPKRLTPLKPNLKWHSLIEDDFEHENLTITCLSSSEQLVDESRILKHCVGTGAYDQKCSDGEENGKSTHILSIRDKNNDNQPISTVEVTLNTEATNPNDYIIINQHRALQNGPPSLKAKEALDAFVTALKENVVNPKLPDNDEELYGETQESIMLRNKNNAPPLFEEIGYEPTWERIEEAFNEYRKDLRSAFADYKKGNEEYITTDSNSPFLGGTVIGEGEKNVPVRELSVKAWLKSSLIHENQETISITDAMQHALTNHRNNLGIKIDTEAINGTPIKSISNDERYALMGYDKATLAEMTKWDARAEPTPHLLSDAEYVGKGTSLVRHGGEPIPSEHLPQR